MPRKGRPEFVRLESPEHEEGTRLSYQEKDRYVTFTVPRVDVYAVIAVALE
jgi:hypothetical protein